MKQQRLFTVVETGKNNIDTLSLFAIVIIVAHPCWQLVTVYDQVVTTLFSWLNNLVHNIVHSWQHNIVHSWQHNIVDSTTLFTVDSTTLFTVGSTTLFTVGSTTLFTVDSTTLFTVGTWQHNIVHSWQHHILHACWQLATGCAFFMHVSRLVTSTQKCLIHLTGDRMEWAR